MAKLIDEFTVEVGINEAYCSIYGDLAQTDPQFHATFSVKDDVSEVGPFAIEQPKEDVYLREFRRYVQQHVSALLYFRNRVRR
ncbi:MAG: hypothetical protein JEZ14_25375 [Marinilabiliaceae bacterium]|nr:hypothetical protein [Marinilabiliaceae bacterium]